MPGRLMGSCTDFNLIPFPADDQFKADDRDAIVAEVVSSSKCAREICEPLSDSGSENEVMDVNMKIQRWMN